MPRPYEIRAELDDGFTFPDGLRWEGMRVKYRPLGSRGAWSTFVLSFTEAPSLAALQEICEGHERASKQRGGA